MTREEAIQHIRDVICENNTIKPNMTVFELEKEALYMAIEALQERKTGKWINCGWSIRCSLCNYDMPWAVRNYCPNCGARME